MRHIVMLLLLSVTGLYGAQRMGDTLWVKRQRPDDRTAQLVILPGWSMVSSNPSDPTCRKVNVTCQVLVRDSLGDVVAIEKRIRIFGMDTSKCEIKYTTQDTIPSDFKEGKFKLDFDGKFKKK